MTEEEQKLFREARVIAALEELMGADMPEGTITTEVYFTDVIVPVMMKKEAPAQQ